MGPLRPRGCDRQQRRRGPGLCVRSRRLPETVRSVIDINLLDVWHGCQIFGRRFIDQGTPAAIYNIGSNSLFNGFPMAASYVASSTVSSR